jgi:hypothetical protein
MKKIAFTMMNLLMTAGMAHAQAYLNCAFAPGWVQSGAQRQYVADNLYEYKDGAAEGYLIFGLVRMQGITCQSGGDTLDIDVSEMGDADSAYGMIAANLDPSMPIASLGMGGQVHRQTASFAKGKYYVEIVETAANPDKNQSAMLKALATAMLEHMEGRDTAPEALQWFPKEDLVSIRLVPVSVLGLSQLKRGYVAKYKQGQAFLVADDSPQAAAAVMKSLRERIGGDSPTQIGDEAFQSQGKYLDGICIFRKGRYVAGYANLPESQQAASQAAKLAARIP